MDAQEAETTDAITSPKFSPFSFLSSLFFPLPYILFLPPFFSFSLWISFSLCLSMYLSNC